MIFFSLRVLVSSCLIFWQFQPCVAYKSIAYEKKRVVTAAERYVIITHVKIKNKRSSRSTKKEEISSYLVYNIVSLGKITGKQNLFRKTS